MDRDNIELKIQELEYYFDYNNVMGEVVLFASKEIGVGNKTEHITKILYRLKGSNEDW